MASKDEFRTFLIELRRAIPRFGARIDDPLVFNAWFQTLGHFTLPALRKSMAAGLLMWPQFPTIKEMYDVIPESEKRPKAKTYSGCQLCLNTGWVRVRKADDPIAEYSFICSCPSASRFKPTRHSYYWEYARQENWILIS
jgi:hypothetical protein